MIKFTFSSAFLIHCVFNTLPGKKRLTFWEISIGLNFTSLTRNEKNPIFDLENGGSTYTQVRLIHK